jgi:cell division protein FtsL
MRSPRTLPRRPTLGVVLRQLLPGAAVAGLLAAVGILHVAARTEVVDTGYALSHLESESRALALENDRLRLELATLKRSARLEKLSRDTLGMAAPASGAVTVLGRPADRPAPPRSLAVAGRRP